MNNKHFFNAAKAISRTSDYTGSSHVHIGCVLVYKGTILAKGVNSNKTHSLQAKYNIYRGFNDNTNNYLPSKCHAEINALTKIKYLDIDFSQVHMFIYREFKNGKYAMARPCDACMRAIQEMGIKHIHYTTNYGLADEIIYERR